MHVSVARQSSSQCATRWWRSQYDHDMITILSQHDHDMITIWSQSLCLSLCPHLCSASSLLPCHPPLSLSLFLSLSVSVFLFLSLSFSVSVSLSFSLRQTQIIQIWRALFQSFCKLLNWKKKERKNSLTSKVRWGQSVCRYSLTPSAKKLLNSG